MPTTIREAVALSGGRRVVVDDGGRPGGVVEAVLAHRAEEHPLEATEATSADHDEVGVGAGVEEGAGGELADGPVDDGPLALVGAERPLDVGGQRRAGLRPRRSRGRRRSVGSAWYWLR